MATWRNPNARKYLTIPSPRIKEHVSTITCCNPLRRAFLLGANITPLDTVSTHFVSDPTRTRKLLLHKKELAQINAGVTQKGQTCVCTALYWKGHLVKARIDLATGKKLHDKRETERDRDWQRQKARIVRDNVKQ